MISGNTRVECQRSTSGGKGNRGKFIERDGRVCAAGIPTAQSDQTVEAALQHYLLKDEVDALLSDAIIPPPARRPLPPLRSPIPPDQRNCATNSILATLVNPPMKTKFQTLVADLKETPYKSYWRAGVGKTPDPIPMFPEGFDYENTTYGVSTKSDYTLYDIVMPKNPLPDKTRPALLPAVQTKRYYCQPAFNPDLTYGIKSNIDKRGCYVKDCLTDINIVNGTSDRCHLNYLQADIQERRAPVLGKVLAPNNNLSRMPEGYSFGLLKCPENLPECLSTCTINPKLAEYRKCLAHLNTLRKVMSTRFLPTFFRKFTLDLKYFDTEKTGWIQKHIIYQQCASRLIRFDSALIEPLLCLLDAFDGQNIHYQTFTHILNFKEPLPQFPKVPDIHPDCLDFRTTYREMVKPGQDIDGRGRAGIPSGRYFDMPYPVTSEGYCKAHRSTLPQETDANCSVKPSIMTLMHVTHREMFAKREPSIVRKVFEGAGEKFTDESFQKVWEEAEKHHSEKWVCFETFRRALEMLETE